MAMMVCYCRWAVADSRRSHLNTAVATEVLVTISRVLDELRSRRTGCVGHLTDLPGPRCNALGQSCLTHYNRRSRVDTRHVANEKVILTGPFDGTRRRSGGGVHAHCLR